MTKPSTALVAAGCLGVFDAISTILRHAAVLLVIPDHLLGRVSAFTPCQPLVALPSGTARWGGSAVCSG
ncbi:MAG: hypothetical protein ACRDKB_04710 [Actinomycetota bacterium]